MLEPSTLWQNIESDLPDLAKLTYPRNYDNVGGYHSPKLMSLGMVIAIGGITHGETKTIGNGPNGLPLVTPKDSNVVHAYGVTLRLLEFMVPTVFVAPELLQAARATKLPKDLNMRDIKWPFPAINFVFPKGAMQSPHDGDIPGLAISHFESGNVTHKSLPPALMPGPSIGYFTLGLQNGGPLFAANLDIRDETTTAWMKRVQETDYTLFADPLGKSSLAPGETITDQDQAFIDDLAALGLKLVMIMTARPQLVEPAVRTRPASVKKGKSRSELWSPYILGRTYQLKRTEGSPKGTPTGRHVILHPVCGHTRIQWYGPKTNPRAESIWIEPTWSGTLTEKHKTT